MKAKEVAELLGVSYQSVLRMARNKCIPHTRLTPKTIRFDKDEIALFIKNCKVEKPLEATAA